MLDCGDDQTPVMGKSRRRKRRRESEREKLNSLNKERECLDEADEVERKRVRIESNPETKAAGEFLRKDLLHVSKP